MIDRQKLETLLSRRFPASTHHQVAAAANAIIGMSEQWDEVSEQELICGDTTQSTQFCALARAAKAGAELRILRRRSA